MTRRTGFILAAIFGFSGIGIVWYSLGWLPALGILLALWGNNMKRSVLSGRLGDE